MPPSPYHNPVMTEEVVRAFAGAPPGPLVDATLGGGGHTAALADATTDDRPLIGVDRDAAALEAARQRLEEGRRLPGRFTFLQGDFGALEDLLDDAGLPANHALAGLLLDLGVSSHQLDDAHRGFGLKHSDAPLDMRMDPSRGATALELLRSLDVHGLARILRDFGEVRGARRLAERILAALSEGHLVTTGDLARLVEAATPARGHRRRLHPATTVFQALRIAVNDELGALDRILHAAPRLLADNGICAIIAYHSLEDRRVKHEFRRGAEGPDRPAHLPPPSDWRPTWRVLTRKPISATDDEIRANPRARSARLRVAARAPLDTRAPR